MTILSTSVTMVTDRAGQLVQHTGYYPYGEPWREPTGQPYLFGGKERLRENALNEYNFTARRYHSALALWTTPDPKSEDQGALNSYIYCAGNPIRFVDPSGCDYYQLQEDGTFKIILETDDHFDILVGRNLDDRLEVEKGFVNPIIEEDIESMNENSQNEVFTASIYKTETNGTAIFEFLAQNSNVEWSNARTSSGVNYIGTSHDSGTDGSMSLLNKRLPEDFKSIIRYDHSHTNDGYTPSASDIDFIETFKGNNRKENFFVYNPNRPKNSRYFFYHSKTDPNTFEGFEYIRHIIPSPIFLNTR